VKHRFSTCVLFGVLVATVLTWFSATHRHVGLVAAAAKAHETPGHLLAAAFGGTAAVVTVIAFIVATIAAASRSSRSNPGRSRAERPHRGRQLRGDGGYDYGGGGYR
jgi:hypothetical protein